MSAELAQQYDLEEIVETFALLPHEQIADQVLKLEAMLIKGERVDCPLEHQFSDGLYMREVFVPAGTLFTTYVHKTEHPYFGSLGELLIWEDGNGWVHMKAPCRGVTKPGTKRIVYAITDVIWTTVHANPRNITDTDKLEDMLFETYENKYLSLAELKTLKCLE